jgi:hypothetical protein
MVQRYIKSLPPPLLQGGGDKSGLWVKKYHKKNDCADKKRRTRERKDKGKEKKSDQMEEKEQFLIKLWETWK